MRSDKQKKHAAFVNLINEIVAAHQPGSSMDFEGFIWAAIKQAIWCESLGISDRTLRELAQHPPIAQTKTKTPWGSPIVLYRLGSEPHKSHRHIANIMGSIFKKRRGLSSLEPRLWGCLYGLAEVWPEGDQIAIFKMVLDIWPEFMAAVKYVEPDTPHAGKYYAYQAITLIRKYHALAVDRYGTELVVKGKELSPAMKALGSKVWEPTDTAIANALLKAKSAQLQPNFPEPSSPQYKVPIPL